MKTCVATLLLLLCIGAAKVNAQTEPLRVGIGTAMPATVFAVAMQKGYFRQQGVDVTWVNCVAGAQCLQDMLAGKMHIAATGDLALMFQAIERRDFVVLTSYAVSNNLLHLLTKRSAGIRSAHDFVGKKVGFVKKSASHYFLDDFLLTSGVDPRKVHHVAIDQELLGSALATGEVDVISTFEPIYSKNKALLGSDALDIDTGIASRLGLHFAMRRDALANQRAQTVKFLRALNLATQFIHREPQEAKRLWAKWSNADAAAEVRWSGTHFRLGIDQSLQTTLQNMLRWAKKEGLVATSASLDFTTLFDPTPLAEARNE